MDLESRIIGELTEFKRATLEKLEKVDERFDHIDGKLEGLYKFRWKFAGAMSVVLFVIQVALKGK